jgi:esterase/lipase superfamily enzyme
MQIRVPNNHLPGNVEYDQNLKLKSIKIDRNIMEQNFVIRGIISIERGEFIDILRSDRRDTALVLVHGYNSSFDNGAFRLAQIVWDGQLYNQPLIPLLFSWPSKNEKAAYKYDEDSAELSVKYFVELLELLQKQAGIKTVHIIAHSMGNRIVLKAISKAANILKSWPLGEVVFAAADVDQDVFIQVIDEVRNISHGMTLYASEDDAALWWSGKAAYDERAGTVTKDGPVVVEGVESIDMTRTNPKIWFLKRFWQKKDLLGLNTHNTFVSPVIDDIARLVENGKHPPPKRTASIRGVPEETPKYWRYAK